MQFVLSQGYKYDVLAFLIDVIDATLITFNFVLKFLL